MNKVSSQEIAAALHDMGQELTSIKKQAEGYMAELEDVKPEELSVPFGGGDEGAPDEGGKPFGGGDEEGAPPEEGEEKGPEGKKHEIKTPADAKKVLEEACKDMQDVIDNLDGLCGTAQSEEKEASLKRYNERYSSSLEKLAESADKAIADAKAAMKHWSFIQKRRNPIVTIKDSNLKQAAQTLQEVNAFQKVVHKLFGQKEVVATAVPPTGAEFTGDKFPAKHGDPKMVEDRTWHKQNDKFNKDKSFEDKRPNPAVDHRLDTVDYARSEEPFVNATLTVMPDSERWSSYWSVVDTKAGKAITAAFYAIPKSVGPKNAATFNEFLSKDYGERIVNHVLQNGIESVASALGADLLEGKQATASLEAEARDPKIKDKAKVRKYYKDAYGDAAFAKGMTSNQKQAEKAQKDMDVEYKPEKEHPKDANPGEQFEKAKDGPNPISSQKEDPELIKAKARKAVEVARKYASRGAIEFTKDAIFKKASELMQLDDATFGIKEATIDELPIVSEAALKEAHIPDAETGIVGNLFEGVRDPKAQVKAEDVDSTVKSDAKISKQANIVPQIQSQVPIGKLSVADSFHTIENRLKQKGLDPTKTRLRMPYKR